MIRVKTMSKGKRRTTEMKIVKTSLITLLAHITLVLMAAPLWAQDEAELAKKLQNPVADLISVPLQSNWDFGIEAPDEAKKIPGLHFQDAYRYTLNVQPVIPISISKDWNLILRTIVPIIHAESPIEELDDRTGLGDILQSFFFSPKEPTSSGWIWGAGPVILYPSGTDELSAHKWGAGPTVVLLKQEKGWTYGILANHVWSFSGGGDNDISSTYLQPFLSYTTKTHTTFSLNTESTYDWEDSEWTVPINLMVAQLVKIGGMPMQFQVGGRYYAEKPDGGPDWGLRFNVTFLFPK
jgi:hypothetical protein